MDTATIHETTKACTKCGDVLPLSGFYARAKAKDGKTSACRVCVLDHLHSDAGRSSRAKYYASDSGRENERQKAARYYRRNRRKSLARAKLRAAVKAGKVRRGPCAKYSPGQGWPCAGRIEGHHESYGTGRELDVVWLCRRHHTQHHAAEWSEKVEDETSA